MFIGHFGLAFAARARRSADVTRYDVRRRAARGPVLADLSPRRRGAGAHLAREPQSASHARFRQLSVVAQPGHGVDGRRGVRRVVLRPHALPDRSDHRRLLVPSHSLLDLVVHVPDLPLYPGGAARFGLGLWRNPVATVIVELIVYFAGVLAYARTTRAMDRIGRFGLWALVVVLLALYAASFGPPPPSVKALAWTALIGWPLTAWPWWVDRHRSVR